MDSVRNSIYFGFYCLCKNHIVPKMSVRKKEDSQGGDKCKENRALGENCIVEGDSSSLEIELHA